MLGILPHPAFQRLCLIKFDFAGHLQRTGQGLPEGQIAENLDYRARRFRGARALLGECKE